MSQLKIWVSCSLTNAPEEYRQMIFSLKDDLKKKYFVYDFLTSNTSTAEDAYKWCTSCVRECDITIVECSYPSIGLGLELGIALQRKIPILALANNDAKVTRLMEGIIDEKYSYIRYNDLEEFYKIVDDFIQKNL
jgi:hypothetical protein